MQRRIPLILIGLLLVACGAQIGAEPPPAPPPTATADLPRLALAAPAGPVAAYGRVELAIATNLRFANPFDPAEADLRVAFTGPDGQARQVPAFWYQAYDPETLRPLGEPGWRVRFTPPTAGEWQAQATLARPAGPALQSDRIRFAVGADPAARGFVRVDPRSPRHFAFESGDPFVPIGPNIAWAASLEQTIPQYRDWLDDLSASGGTVARVWMASWSFGIEWTDTGLGDYSGRLKQAYLLDQVFTMAEERQIALMLCLLNHGAFSASTNPEWDANPYNVANGGMLSDPAQFVTDPAAKELFKRRVRYIAARWGYAPNLFAWEWWNEVNWTPIADDQLLPWVVEMTAHLRQFDPNDHLVSSSYADGPGRPLWDLPEIDFAQEHDYSGGDPVRVLRSSMEAFAERAPAKPVLLAEHGLSAGGAEDSYGRERIHLHNGIWAPPFLGYAGSGMAWWWDTYIDPQGLWGVYKPLADFLAGERLADLTPTRAGAGDPGVSALALQGPDRALVWVRSRAYDANEAYLAYAKALRERTAGPNWVYEPPVRAGLTLTVSGLADGPYTARWFSPQTGEWLGEAAATSQGGTLTLPIPDFSHDLAVKIAGGSR